MEKIITLENYNEMLKNGTLPEEMALEFCCGKGEEEDK